MEFCYNSFLLQIFTLKIYTNNIGRYLIKNWSDLYLYYFWLSKTKELRNINMGAAQPNLNADLIKNYLVPYCSFKEQQQIVSELESKLTVCDKIKETINIGLQQAETLRQSILKKAFEGKLV